MRTLSIFLIGLLISIKIFCQSIDSSFGKNGKIFPNIPVGENGYFSNLFVQNNNKIVAFLYKGCENSNQCVSGHYLVRYNADGTPDETFGNKGEVSLEPFISSDARDPANILQESNEKLLVVINSRYDSVRVIRFNKNGSPDVLYGNNGIFKIKMGFTRGKISAGLQKGNRLIIGGSTDYFADKSFLARVTPNGRLDSGFAKNGIFTKRILNSSARENILALTIDSTTQDIFFAGESYYSDELENGTSFLAKCKANGKVDQIFTVFKGDGIFGSNYGVRPFSIDISPDRKFIYYGAEVVGKNETYNRHHVWKLQMNGIPDSTFGEFGRLLFNWRTQYTMMRIGEYGDLYFSGNSFSGYYSTLPGVAIVQRLTASGKPDADFGDKGFIALKNGDLAQFNSFDFHGRSNNNKGLVMLVSSGHSFIQSFIIRYRNEPAGQSKQVQNIAAGLLNDNIVPFRVYPNPVHATLNFKIDTDNIKKMQVRIADLSGKQLYAEKIIPAGSVTTHTINVSRFHPGAYFITIETDAGNNKARFIKR